MINNGSCAKLSFHDLTSYDVNSLTEKRLYGKFVQVSVIPWQIVFIDEVVDLVYHFSRNLDYFVFAYFRDASINLWNRV